MLSFLNLQITNSLTNNLYFVHNMPLKIKYTSYLLEKFVNVYLLIFFKTIKKFSYIEMFSNYSFPFLTTLKN